MISGEKVKHGGLWTVLFSLVSLAWIFPIVLVIINSFKQKAYISRNAFSIPAGKAFVGLENYTRGIETTNFFASFGWTLLITVGSVILILVCTSMCAWWIVRVNNWAAKLLYTLFLFNMIVPFQMVMFTLSKLADMLKLNTPWGLCIVYLGFGAGLAVFIFTGVVKGIPQSLEESAMIDGASVPRIFFQIVVPIMKPSIVSVAILQAMWIWNDYLLPYLTLDLGKYKTISVAIQYLKGGYGSVDMGAMMACLVMAIIPIIVFYLICQKHIVQVMLVQSRMIEDRSLWTVQCAVHAQPERGRQARSGSIEPGRKAGLFHIRIRKLLHIFAEHVLENRHVNHNHGAVAQNE